MIEYLRKPQGKFQIFDGKREINVVCMKRWLFELTQRKKGNKMESAKKQSSAASSLTADLFGVKEPPPKSSTGIFASIFPPPSQRIENSPAHGGGGGEESYYGLVKFLEVAVKCFMLWPSAPCLFLNRRLVTDSLTEFYRENSPKRKNNLFLIVVGRNSSSSELTEYWQKQSLGNHAWNTKQGCPAISSEGARYSLPNKDRSSVLQEERAEPCHLSSSLYYGGQEVYSQSPSTHASGSYPIFKKDGGEDDPNGSNSNSAARGNWWQACDVVQAKVIVGENVYPTSVPTTTEPVMLASLVAITGFPESIASNKV
ncbi:hypothetical protein Prudu_015932 [Prunus dulcis]|uniref:Uncharacterized protein n=1 Tax=Prunus dulcis TaxID=3755 RepID=A0A4Y1RK46_PRUDU|nr:hypothetical protein Prudu_015932 [Prunus dulcis]